MDNLQNTSAEGTQTSTEGTQKSGKIFTQEDVNRIVQERLAKEKNKASGNEELDQRTAELDKRAADLEAKENRLNTLEILRSAGYPDELADVIRCGNSEELKKSMEIIDNIIKERTPEGRSKELDAKRSRIIGTSIHMQENDDSSSIRKAMGLRGK